MVRRFENNSSCILKFSEWLSELLNGGVSLQDSLQIISELRTSDKRISDGCGELKKNLEFGMNFSVALSVSQYFDFPEWYVSMVSVAEENGNLGKIFSYVVKTLNQEKMIREKYAGALLYPFFVALLTIISGLIAVLYFPSISEGKAETGILNETWKSFFYGCVFLLFSYGSMACIFFRIICEGRNLTGLNAFGFLMEAKVPVLKAFERVTFTLKKNERLKKACEIARSQLLAGSGFGESFSAGLKFAGFKREAELFLVKLKLWEFSGNSEGFSQVCRMLSDRLNKKQQSFFTMLQPLLMCVTGIFMVIVMRPVLETMFSMSGGI